MFDIGFTEIVLVSVVGLLVLGPERLPGAVRTASLWLGRLRRSFNNIRSEIEREINAEEIKRDLHNDAVMQSLKEAERDLRGLNNIKDWHLVVFPLGALFLTLLTVVFIGEAIREAFDPKVFSRLR